MTHPPLIADPTQYTCELPFPAADRIRIYDSTLRDGEQMPGVAFSPQQKLRLACELSQIGCHVLDIGFPIVSDTEHQAVEMILRARRTGALPREVEIVLMSRCVEDDITRTVKCVEDSGCDPADVTLLLFTSASPLHCRYKLGPMLMARAGLPASELADVPFECLHDINRQLVADSVQLARDLGVQVEFGAEDASRTEIVPLIELVRAAIDAGATRYVFADTTGCLTPEATRLYCSALAQALPGVELATHFHNDFDLATINTITALQCGFTVCSTTANGIGERAGNAPMHAVVVALRFLYGIELPGFRYDRLNALRKLVEDFSGVPVQCHEPVIGRNAFAHESGIHVHGVSKNRLLYEAVPLERVGGVPRRVFGKHSGLSGVLTLLREHQSRIPVPVTRELAEAVVAEVKRQRQARISEAGHAESMREYYDRLDRLGLSEDEVIDCALRCLREVASTRGA
ncbi:MAG: LeuA family protein [Vicinamibacterales bacterium]